ncbi:hypothetical protein Dimus_010933 [Dionaea muscipula]
MAAAVVMKCLGLGGGDGDGEVWWSGVGGERCRRARLMTGGGRWSSWCAPRWLVSRRRRENGGGRGSRRRRRLRRSSPWRSSAMAAAAGDEVSRLGQAVMVMVKCGGRVSAVNGVGEQVDDGRWLVVVVVCSSVVGM